MQRNKKDVYKYFGNHYIPVQVAFKPFTNEQHRTVMRNFITDNIKELSGRDRHKIPGRGNLFAVLVDGLKLPDNLYKLIDFKKQRGSAMKTHLLALICAPFRLFVYFSQTFNHLMAFSSG